MSTDEPKKHSLTWERSIEILKVLATVWVAGVGTIVTMQFNERQHELNRIEAIAKMLPHLSQQDEAKHDKSHGGKSGTSAGVKLTNGKGAANEASLVTESGAGKANYALASNKSPRDRTDEVANSDEMHASVHRGSLGSHQPDMSRDGAIWAIFRTANNRTMLRDLASLFPEDIYRVVSSIAAADSLEHDEDALTALQVASEKLAVRYSNTEHKELAARLFSQAIRLKQRKEGDRSPLYIVDLSEGDAPADPLSDETASLLASVNKLGEMHLKDAEKNKKVNTAHWQAKQLFKRARQLGLGSKDKAVQMEVAAADVSLSKIYEKENRLNDAVAYLAEARKMQSQALGEESPTVNETDARLAELKLKLEQVPVQRSTGYEAH